GLNRLMLVRANIDHGPAGWFLLDTGAAYTTLSPALGTPQLAPHALAVSGMQGGASGFRLGPLALQGGGRAMHEREAITFELGAISQREGVEISGILGYSTLSQWPLTIDFRSGLVRIGDR